MRSILMNLLALPFLVACTGNNENHASPPPSNGDASQRVAASAQREDPDAAQDQQGEDAAASSRATLETVHSEPANKRAPKDVAPSDAARRAARVAQEDAEIARDVDYEAQGGPEGTNDMAQKLRAYHPDMLPTREELRMDPTSVERLLFIEDNAAMLLERQRALILMRHVYINETRRRLMDRAQDRSQHVSVRTAALRTLARVVDPNDRQVQEILENARAEDEPRIQKAATLDE